MSGIIGHTVYALLASHEAKRRGLPLARLIEENPASYLAGAYLGCDVQTVPNAICLDSGEPVGHGPVTVERSPLTGGGVKPWTLGFQGRKVTPREIHDTFYGRAHLILGWSGADQSLAIRWTDFLDYAADVAGDAAEIFDAPRRAIAYVLGWFTHVVGDGLIKSVLDGINLHLIDGQYTATNRPIQDLVTYHEIGIRELGLDWKRLLSDLAATPIEPIQIHYMRCGPRQGRLGAHTDSGWAPDQEPLLREVLQENRHYQSILNARLIEEMALSTGPGGLPACHPALSAAAGGLSYPEMLAAAEASHFREAVYEIGALIADGFEKVASRQDRLIRLG